MMLLYASLPYGCHARKAIVFGLHPYRYALPPYGCCLLGEKFRMTAQPNEMYFIYWFVLLFPYQQ